MSEAIVCFFAVFLILCGLFFIFYLLVNKALSDGNDNFFAVVEGYEEKAELESEIYSALIQINMMNFGKKRDVYVIDYNLKESTKIRLIKSSAALGRVVFVKIEDKKIIKE